MAESEETQEMVIYSHQPQSRSPRPSSQQPRAGNPMAYVALMAGWMSCRFSSRLPAYLGPTPHTSWGPREPVFTGWENTENVCSILGSVTVYLCTTS